MQLVVLLIMCLTTDAYRRECTLLRWLSGTVCFLLTIASMTVGFLYLWSNYYSAPTGERNNVMSNCVLMCLCVCLSEIISSELHVQSSPNFLCALSVAMARFSSGGIVIRYVLPVLRMTLYLHIS